MSTCYRKSAKGLVENRYSMTTEEAFNQILGSEDFGKGERFLACVETISEYRWTLSREQNTKTLYAMLLLLAQEANETLGKCPGNLSIQVSSRFGIVRVRLVTPGLFWKKTVEAQEWKIDYARDICCYRNGVKLFDSGYNTSDAAWLSHQVVATFRTIFSSAAGVEKASRAFEAATKIL